MKNEETTQAAGWWSQENYMAEATVRRGISPRDGSKRKQVDLVARHVCNWLIVSAPIDLFSSPFLVLPFLSFPFLYLLFSLALHVLVSYSFHFLPVGLRRCVASPSLFISCVLYSFLVACICSPTEDAPFGRYPCLFMCGLLYFTCSSKRDNVPDL